MSTQRTGDDRLWVGNGRQDEVTLLQPHHGLAIDDAPLLLQICGCVSRRVDAEYVSDSSRGDISIAINRGFRISEAKLRKLRAVLVALSISAAFSSVSSDFLFLEQRTYFKSQEMLFSV